MNQIELNLMKGMISVLNEAQKRPILSSEQYEVRLADLKQFEQETNFAYMNSPTCKNNVYSVVEVKNIPKYNLRKCHDIESIVEFANQKEMLVYPSLVGTNITIAYNDGIMTNLTIDNIAFNLNEVDNVPYKINRTGVYIVSGILTHDLKFYVNDVIDGGGNILKGNLKEAEELGFDIVHNWIASTLNPKHLQNNIDYVFDYMLENELSCNGIVFMFNDVSCIKDGIVYEKSNE